MSARPATRTDDAAVERVLQAGDPLPEAPALDGELAIAIPRTRAAVAAGADARAAGGVRPRGAGARRGQASDAGPVAAFVRHPAPWGILHLAAGDRGILAIELASETGDFVDDLARRLGGPVVPDRPGLPRAWRDALAAASRELDEYFAGERMAFDVPVDLAGVSAWDRLVLDGARRLSYGEVTSYGALARAIGRPRAARAVGGALGRNPVPLMIPCHRIVAGDGTLGGYGGGGRGARARLLEVKRSLLALEGARVAG